MSDFPISDEGVEAAARANVEGGLKERRGDWDGMTASDKRNWIEGERAAIQAFLVAGGFEVQRDNRYEGGANSRPHHRLVSKWRPDE